MSTNIGVDGKRFDTDLISVGRKRPTVITGTTAVVGDFKVIMAMGGDAELAASNAIYLNGVVDDQYDGLTIDKNVPLPFGADTITSIQLSSGTVWAW